MQRAEVHIVGLEDCVVGIIGLNNTCRQKLRDQEALHVCTW